MTDPRTPITWREFKEGTGLNASCWIFKEAKKLKFFKSESNHYPVTYYFDNGRGQTYEFKYMKQYGETWMRKWDFYNDSGIPSWSLWNTFKVWD